MGVGPVAGTDHYVTLDYEEENDEEYRCFLTERNEKNETVREFPLDFLGGSSVSEVMMNLSDFAVDSAGVAHLVYQEGQRWRYLLSSQEGEVLAEYDPGSEDIRELVPLYDGRVAFWSAAVQGGSEFTNYIAVSGWKDRQAGAAGGPGAGLLLLYTF